MSTNFPASIFSISFVGTGNTKEKLNVMKLSRPGVSVGVEGSLLMDVIGGSCLVAVI